MTGTVPRERCPREETQHHKRGEATRLGLDPSSGGTLGVWEKLYHIHQRNDSGGEPYDHPTRDVQGDLRPSTTPDRRGAVRCTVPTRVERLLGRGHVGGLVLPLLLVVLVLLPVVRRLLLPPARGEPEPVPDDRRPEVETTSVVPVVVSSQGGIGSPSGSLFPRLPGVRVGSNEWVRRLQPPSTRSAGGPPTALPRRVTASP